MDKAEEENKKGERMKNFDHQKAKKTRNRRTKNAHNQFVRGRKNIGKKYAEGIA